MTIVNKRREAWRSVQKEREAILKEEAPKIVEAEYIVEDIIGTSEELIKSG